MTATAKVSRLGLQAYSPVVTVEEAMHYAQAAAVEAYNEAREAGCGEEAAHKTASEAYRNALPALSGRGNVRG